jgi:hypothetical protein
MIKIQDLKEGDTFWAVDLSLPNIGDNKYAIEIIPLEHLVTEVEKTHLHAKGKYELIYFTEEIDLYETPDEASNALLTKIYYNLLGKTDIF